MKLDEETFSCGLLGQVVGYSESNASSSKQIGFAKMKMMRHERMTLRSVDRNLGKEKQMPYDYQRPAAWWTVRSIGNLGASARR